jgi:hypothetical protein
LYIGAGGLVADREEVMADMGGGRYCFHCGTYLGAEQDFWGVEFSQGDADIVVFNIYPPGDCGLGYACGATCFEAYVKENMVAGSFRAP